MDKEEAGFYTTTRKTLQNFLGTAVVKDTSAEDAIVSAALQNAGAAGASLAFKKEKKGMGYITPLLYNKLTFVAKPVEHPFCDRCHDIIHHNSGVSIHHPTPTAIQDTILESPHKYNHIYHIIDAADFPMSVIPQLQKLLHATPQRSHNRRAKSEKFYHGKQIEMSFIITRSDLLAAKKEQVDVMMPYLRATLRDALGRSAKDARLGNVKCVSAQRQWWTGGLKEEIYKHGGGSWMVGKVNVGKSRLLHEVFPKGKREAGSTADGYKKIALVANEADAESTAALTAESSAQDELSEDTPLSSLGEDIEATGPDFIDTTSLLPPLPAEVNYPTMPIVSSLPGTTASPIRLSFGHGKGEMIDLPGLSRGDLEKHVEPAFRDSLVMRSRIEPKQQNIQPGQSLLLGGFIRITPTSDMTYLMYNFTPLEGHRTATYKAIEVQARGEEARNVQNIALPEAAPKTKLAGTFHLKWDVTKQRAGPLTNAKMVGMKPENLPFRVLATDLLIEGVGWVELVAQVRRPRGDAPSVKSEAVVAPAATPTSSLATYTPLGTSPSTTQPEKTVNTEHAEQRVSYTPFGSPSPSTLTPTITKLPASDVPALASAPSLDPSLDPDDEVEVIDESWPAFEVYTPDGKFVTTRRPMNAWMNVLSKPKKAGIRPRKSMKGKKKEAKQLKRGW